MLALAQPGQLAGSLTPKVDLCEPQTISHCQIKARNDLEAVESWLSQCDNPNTQRAYRLEAQRLILWCLYVNGQPFKDLTKDDLQAFVQFLSAPPSTWQTVSIRIEVEGKIRQSRPFKYPLAGTTLAKSITAINSLMNYLVLANYLAFNPIALLKRQKKLAKGNTPYTTMARILEDDEWQAIVQTLSCLPEISEANRKDKARYQFIFAMLYFLGLRADELISHTWNAFRKRAGQWWFFVEGKGSRQSHLPIHPQLMQVIKVYRQSLGLESVMPVASEIAPLLLSKKNDQGLGYEQLYNLVKSIAQQAANQFEQGSSEYQKLMKCSPHWLRHLFASHLDRRGTPYHLVQRLLRHAKEDVSKIYIHQDDKQLLEAISVLTMPLTMVSQKLKHNSVCKITLQGDGAQGYLFERFLYVLEHFIFKDTVVNKGYDTLSLVETFKQHSKLGQSMVLTYQFKQILGKAEQLLMANLIEQAADIRLLRASVAII